MTNLRARAHAGSDEGFTLLEMIVALSLLALTLVSVAHGVYTGMSVMNTARHKTAFLELANAEAETIRALDYGDAGVRSADVASAYTLSGAVYQHNGRDAVIVASANAPSPVETVTSTPLSNRPTPYTIRRWVTWTDPAGGTTRRFKRIDVSVEWLDARGGSRSIAYSTLFYPGNLGTIAGTPPTAAFTVTPTFGYAGSTNFAVDASASTGAATYAWDFGDSTAGTGVTASHTYTAVGRRTISLVVTNAAGLSSTPVTRNVLVGTAPGIPAPPGNRPPTAAFVITPSPATGAGPLAVNVDASASSDPDGDPLSYVWTWGDGSPAGSGPSAGHAFANPGTYTLQLTVSDPAAIADPSTAATTNATVTVVGQTCAVTSASFKNPTTNATNNEIDIRANDRPENTGFVFTAVTNADCTAMVVAVPTQSGNFNATLALVSSTPTSKTWGVTATNDSKYNTGNAQSATFTATSSTATAVPFTVSFRVFR